MAVLMSAEVDLSRVGEAPAQADIQADAEALLVAAKLPETELSLVICDDPTIQALNARWRGKDEPTDVLSFPQDDEIVLGDLVISVDTALRQARERGHDLRCELRVLLVHGLLHLLGYDHETGPADFDEMMDAEQRLMRRLGWTGAALIERASR